MALPAIENYTDEKLRDLLDAYLADGGNAETLRTALDVALEPAPLSDVAEEA